MLFRSDRVEVHVDAVPEDHLEVAVRDVGARVADLVGAPAALDRPLDFARRAGVDADALGRPRRAESAEDVEDLGQWVRLQREPEPKWQAGPGQRRRRRRAFSANRARS